MLCRHDGMKIGYSPTSLTFLTNFAQYFSLEEEFRAIACLISEMATVYGNTDLRINIMHAYRQMNK